MRSVTAVAGLAVLAACATPPVPAPVVDDSAVFTADGRMSVVVARDSAPQASSGKFNWVEHASTSQIVFFSPLGDTVAQIEVSPARSVLRTPQWSEEAQDPETLLERNLGFALPVLGLRDWLRGRARDGAVRAPEPFVEDGWQVSFPQMQAQGGLPRIVRLQRALPEPVDVRIVIDHWNGEGAR